MPKPIAPEEELVDLYRKAAKDYDHSGIGALQAKRREAVGLLKLEPGDIVVDIGCGTGLNFPFLQAAVGPAGRIIGVDLTDAMLDQARQRVSENGWQNIELVQSDASRYAFSASIDGIISTFALTFMPDAHAVIQNGVHALAAGKRFVVLDVAWPKGWPMGLRHLIPHLSSFGITTEVIRQWPWLKILDSMSKHLFGMEKRNFWLGFFYLAYGTKAGQ